MAVLQSYVSYLSNAAVCAGGGGVNVKALVSFYDGLVAMTLSFVDCSVIGNIAQNGACGVCATAAMPANSTPSEKGNGGGGGVLVRASFGRTGSSILSFANCTLTSNTVCGACGGSLPCLHASVSRRRVCTGPGAGVHAEVDGEGSMILFEDCTVSSNIANAGRCLLLALCPAY